MPKKPNHPPEESLGLERIVFFSDAVMAIAITLLAIDIRVPEIDPAAAAAELPKQLAAITPNLLTFFISFIVIGIYWISHHRYFSYIKRYDTRLMLLNLMFLFFIACMPFVASLLGRFPSVPIALVIYTLAVAALGTSMALIWRYASKDHLLVEPDLEAGTIKIINIRLFVAPLMFLVAVPFAFVSKLAVIIVWWLSPLVVILATRLWARK
jgi:uncharacterized membrane protein